MNYKINQVFNRFKHIFTCRNRHFISMHLRQKSHHCISVYNVFQLDWWFLWAWRLWFSNNCIRVDNTFSFLLIYTFWGWCKVNFCLGSCLLTGSTLSSWFWCILCLPWLHPWLHPRTLQIWGREHFFLEVKKTRQEFRLWLYPVQEANKFFSHSEKILKLQRNKGKTVFLSLIKD